MALIPQETVEQITAANDIVEVVGGYIPLKRAGGMWKALCPFHQERTPSFSVNPQRQIFKCFGCGAGGSVIRFVMSYENLDFVAAARKLAERAGIKIVEQEMSDEDRARVTMRRRLLSLHLDVAGYFHAHLMKRQSAQIARDYLKSRGISGEIAKAWNLGYAPDEWHAMREFARGAGYSDEELIASGLVTLRDEETGGARQFYDRFRGRVMFPICNENGEVIGFSGRVLEKDAKGAKYVNSPETMLFTKGAVLFGLHKSKRALIEKSSVIVCEGQLDLITAFEAGIQNVVAPQGTAFTPKQARVLKRYVEEAVLCFDSDSAGDKAAERSLPSLLAEGITVRVATMPAGEDPDSLIRGRGAAAFVERIAAAKDFFDFQIEKLSGQPEFQTALGKMRAARKMAEFISHISDAVLREAVINKLCVRLEISSVELVKLLKQPKPTSLEAESHEDGEAAPLVLDEGLRLLALVALHSEAAREWLLEEHWEEVLAEEPGGSLVAKILGFSLRPGDIGSATALLSTLDAAEEAVVTGLLNQKPPAHPEVIAHDCWRDLERRRIQRRIEALKARQKVHGLAFEELSKLHEEILDLQKRLSDIARPLSPPL